MANFINCLLGDVLYLKNGYAFKSSAYQKEGIPVIRISDINNGLVSITEAVKVYHMPDGFNFLVSKGDILIAMSGATTGKFGLYDGDRVAYQNQRVGNLKLYSDEFCDKKFIYYLLFSKRRDIERTAYGGAQPNISGEKIEHVNIKFYALSEQHQIVSIIEEMFSDLDNAIENLKKAQEQLKVYRQSILKHAFDGRITEAWRKKHNKNNERFDNLLGNLTLSSRNGFTGKPNDKKNGNPRIGITSITQSDSICVDISKFRYMPISNEIIETYAVLKGDVMVCRRNGNKHFVGKFGVVRENVNGLIYSDSLIRFRIDTKRILPEYLAYYCNSIVRKDIDDLCSTTAGNYSINSTSIKTLNIKYYPKDEQSIIVQEIESRFSVCDKMEETINSSLEQVEVLRQSILKQAFEGKLTEEWRKENKNLISGENSAEALLEKIKAEKEALQVKSKGKKKHD